MRRLTQPIMELAEKLGALRQGNYTLSSGASSRFYFDGRLLTLHPQGINLITRITLRLAHSSSAQAAGGPAIAAVPLVATLVQESPKVSRIVQEGKPATISVIVVASQIEQTYQPQSDERSCNKSDYVPTR